MILFKLSYTSEESSCLTHSYWTRLEAEKDCAFLQLLRPDLRPPEQRLEGIRETGCIPIHGMPRPSVRSECMFSMLVRAVDEQVRRSPLLKSASRQRSAEVDPSHRSLPNPQNNMTCKLS